MVSGVLAVIVVLGIAPLAIATGHPRLASLTFGASSKQHGIERLRHVNSDGTHLGPLLSAVGFLGGRQTWSPDGRAIAFGCNGGICVVDSRTAGREFIPQVCEQRCDFDWAPDSRQLVITSDHYLAPSTLTVFSVEGSKTRKLTTLRGPASAPSWSPNAKSIAVLIDDARPSTLQVIDVRSRRVRTIGRADPMYPAGRPSWSPDSSRLAYSLRGRITIARGSGATSAVVAGRQASFSPDGRRIAFLRIHSKALGVTRAAAYIANEDGSKATAIMVGVATPPVWSPDGRLVAAGQSNPRGLGQRLVVVDTRLGTARVVAGGFWEIGSVSWRR